jgi:hypothetical protein
MILMPKKSFVIPNHAKRGEESAICAPGKGPVYNLAVAAVAPCILASGNRFIIAIRLVLFAHTAA